VRSQEVIAYFDRLGAGIKATKLRDIERVEVRRVLCRYATDRGPVAAAAALLDRGALDARQLRDLWLLIQHPAAAALMVDRERRALRSRRGDHWRVY
jgi:hypothetical protein